MEPPVDDGFIGFLLVFEISGSDVWSPKTDFTFGNFISAIIIHLRDISEAKLVTLKWTSYMS